MLCTVCIPHCWALSLKDSTESYCRLLNGTHLPRSISFSNSPWRAQRQIISPSSGSHSALRCQPILYLFGYDSFCLPCLRITSTLPGSCICPISLSPAASCRVSGTETAEREWESERRWELGWMNNVQPKCAHWVYIWNQRRGPRHPHAENISWLSGFFFNPLFD